MDKFFKEYSSEEAIQKYTKETAGFGISYLLENDYGKIYLEAINRYLPPDIKRTGINILEFGCGGGMNLIHLVSIIERQGIHIQSAYGTDFSSKLIDAATTESKKYLSTELQKKVSFCVARNENLIQNLAAGLNVDRHILLSSFHLIIGVNTFRYCHRMNKELECARDISSLLAKEGVCIIIDMNDKFPFFRSKIKDWRTLNKEERYLPSIDEYARPFSEAGFQILEKENFCWIPHSAGPGLTKVCKVLTPLLDLSIPSRAIRSLVIAKKN